MAAKILQVSSKLSASISDYQNLCQSLAGACAEIPRPNWKIAMRVHVLCCILGLTGLLHANSNSFGPISVPGNSVIFDPDNVLSEAELASLGSCPPIFTCPLGAVPAVKALSFAAASGQIMTFSATGVL
jgi:hypothetical protein